MSPHLLRSARASAYITRRLAQPNDGTGARYPRDYYRPLHPRAIRTLLVRSC